jgi:hypothetical protein
MIDSGKKVTSFVLGIIIAAIGLFPLLNKFGIIGFAIPGLNLVLSFAFYLMIIGAVLMLVDAHLEDHALKVPSTIVGIVMLAVAAVEVIAGFGIIAFHIPMIAVALPYLLVLEGAFLIIGAFAV